jgi:aspartyl/asparaginyl beta-hydroxylase (cupin superfamily)
MTHLEPTRRTLLAAGTLLAVPTPLLAATPANKKLVFSVLRNGERIGEHRMTFPATRFHRPSPQRSP